MLNREQFFNQAANFSQKPTYLDLPELGDGVYIKAMTAKEREIYEEKVQDVKEHEVRATVAVLCVCDENGNLVFDDSDVSRLNDLPSKILMKIFAKFNELNGVGADEVRQIEKK